MQNVLIEVELEEPCLQIALIRAIEKVKDLGDDRESWCDGIYDGKLEFQGIHFQDNHKHKEYIFRFNASIRDLQ